METGKNTDMTFGFNAENVTLTSEVIKGQNILFQVKKVRQSFWNKV